MTTYDDVKNDFIHALEDCREKALKLSEEFEDNEIENDYLKMVAETFLDQIEHWKKR